MRRDRRRLPFRALELRHIGRRRFLSIRDVVVGDIERAHGIPPIIPALPWHTEPAFSRPSFESGKHPMKLRARRSQPCVGQWQEAGEAQCPGGLAGLVADQVLADLDLDMRQGSAFAMHRYRVVARIGDRVGGVVADREVALRTQADPEQDDMRRGARSRL